MSTAAKQQVAPDAVALLHAYGLKATAARASLLSVLQHATKPLSVAEVKERLRQQIHHVTIYRSIDSFLDAGLIRQTDFRQGYARYEFAPGRSHHHHVICSSCGVVEAVPECDAANLEKQVLSHVGAFACVTAHALEFFGICRVCVSRRAV